MFRIQQLTDPMLHKAACRISNQLALILKPALPGVSQHDIVKRAYELLREELAAFDRERGSRER